MANKFYAPGERRGEKVGDLFATIARRYDLLNDILSFGLHRRWKRLLVDLAGVQPGDRALDLCCGTGDIAFALGRRGAEVVGADFSGAMLAVARARKSKVQSLKSDVGTARPRVEFLRGDAQQIPFLDNSFDIVTVGYGLRNLASWEAGLREMQRVAKPGGRLLVLDFGKPDNALWRKLYFAYLRTLVPLFGRLFCGDAAAYAYISESLEHYPAQHGVAAKMRELGLVEVRTLNLLGGIMSISSAERPK